MSRLEARFARDLGLRALGGVGVWKAGAVSDLEAVQAALFITACLGFVIWSWLDSRNAPPE